MFLAAAHSSVRILRHVSDPSARAGLRGHCNSPIAGYSTTEPDGRLGLRAMVFSRGGSKCAHARLWSETRNDPGALGSRVAAELLRQGARDIIDGILH
ncbi:hypothetical protein ACGFN1_37760 [Streptomyces sp. NPDC048685]|uniref:hypothetical protein n=1 Tax=Streptomyces sp. NPDC048685 TaxID=3365584 RepID=UPI0037165F8F